MQTATDSSKQALDYLHGGETLLLETIMRFAGKEQPDVDGIREMFAAYPPSKWLNVSCKTAGLEALNLLDSGIAPTPYELGKRISNRPECSTQWLAEIATTPTHLNPTTATIAARELKQLSFKLTQWPLMLAELNQTVYSPDAPLALLADKLKTFGEDCAAADDTPPETYDPTEAWLKELEAGPPQLLKTPWSGLDATLGGGVSPASLVVLAARPAVGKSALALNWAWNAAALGRNVVFFSLEMKSGELNIRLFSNLSDLPLKIFKFKLSAEEFKRLYATKQRFDRLAGGRFHIVDDFGLDIEKMRSICRLRAKIAPLGLVVVDYLQLMRADPKISNREQQIAALSRGLKMLAGEFDCPVLCLSQLNRQSEAEDRAPRPSDLRESGAIEQDADVILMLHRENALVEAGQEVGVTGEPLQVIVAKNRMGPTGSCMLQYRKEVQRITDPDEDFRSRVMACRENLKAQSGRRKL